MMVRPLLIYPVRPIRHPLTFTERLRSEPSGVLELAVYTKIGTFYEKMKR